jgi:hypothetical protein
MIILGCLFFLIQSARGIEYYPFAHMPTGNSKKARRTRRAFYSLSIVVGLLGITGTIYADVGYTI